MSGVSANPFLLVGGKYFLNWRNHITFALSALFTAVAFDAERLGGRPSDWLWFGVFGVLITVLPLEIARPLIRRFAKSKALAVSIALVVAGLIRGTVLFLVGQQMGLVPPSDIFYRLVGGPIFVFFIYLISSSVVEPYLNFKDQTKQLEAEKQRLEQAKSSYAQDLMAFNQQQRSRVRELLSPPIWELQKKLSEAGDRSAVQEALIKMQVLNNEIVRPLSHQLAKEINPERLDVVGGEATQRLAWPRSIRLSENLPFGFFLLISLPLGFSSQITSAVSITGLLLAVVTLLVASLFLAVEKLLLSKICLPAWLAIPLSICLAFLSGLTGALVSTSIGLESGPTFWLLSATYMAIVKLFTLAYALVQRSWIAGLQDLAGVTDELRKVNSWLRQQLWLGQKSLAMELHGSVQSTLHAMAAKLSKMNDVQKTELDEVVTAIRDSLGRIENEEYLAGGSLLNLLEELQELWEGTAEVQWKISPEAQEVLDRDLGLARCLFEVIRETVVNSVKHGDAREIQIEIGLEGEKLMLSVTNDGSLVARPAGEGEKLFNQICLTHSVATRSDSVVFEAELAVSL